VCHIMPHRPKPVEYEEQDQEEIGLVLVGAGTLVPC
jgi:hypothetical protein